MNAGDSMVLVESTVQTIEHVMADPAAAAARGVGLGAALQRHADDFARRTGIAVSSTIRPKRASASLASRLRSPCFARTGGAQQTSPKHAAANQGAWRSRSRGRDACAQRQRRRPRVRPGGDPRISSAGVCGRCANAPRRRAPRRRDHSPGKGTSVVAKRASLMIRVLIADDHAVVAEGPEARHRSADQHAGTRHRPATAARRCA